MSSTKFADNPDIDKFCNEMEVESCPYSVFQGWWGVESKMPKTNQTLELLDDNDPGSASRIFLNFDHPVRSTCPCKIFWRAEYARLKDKILYAIEPQPDSVAGIIITGQTGVGISVFLLAMCFIFLIKKKEFIFLWRGNLYLFVKKDDTLAVYKTKPDRSEMIQNSFPYLPALLDVDKLRQEPPQTLTSPLVFPIQATSLEVVRYKCWRKDMMYVPFFCMDIWDENELREGLTANGIVVDHLPSLINLYGYALQPIMKAIRSPGQAKEDQHMALSCIKNAQDLITCLARVRSAIPSVASDLLIAIRSHPGADEKSDSPYYDFVSPYVRLQLMSRLRDIKLEQAIDLYDSFYPYKDSSLTGWAFETIVNHILSHSLNTHTTRTFDDQHLFLSGADDGTGFIMTRKAEELFPRLSIKPVYVDFARLSALERALENLSSSPTNPSIPAVYLIPEDQSNSVFDSVLVEGGGCVWVIKSNLGKAHESNESDTPLLRNLHKAIRACGGDPYYRYLHVTAAEKMTATPSSNIPSFSTARNVFYLPLCWDSLNKFSSSSTFELEVLDNEQSDVGSVSL